MLFGAGTATPAAATKKLVAAIEHMKDAAAEQEQDGSSSMRLKWARIDVNSAIRWQRREEDDAQEDVGKISGRGEDEGDET